MIPQIVSFDGGINNADLKASGSRIVRGNSWRKQRIVVVLPAAETIPTKIALAHWSLAFPPNQAVYRMAALGQEVGEAYSNAIEMILAHPELSTWEYLLSIEHDNAPPSDGVLRLIKSLDDHPELCAVSGLYWTKGLEGPNGVGGGVPQIWGDPNDTLNFRPQPPRAGEVVECCGIGMGFALWRLATFKDSRLRRPWFKTQADASGVGTQDLYFASDARKHGYRFGVDCGCLTGHYDMDGRFGIPDTMY